MKAKRVRASLCPEVREQKHLVLSAVAHAPDRAVAFPIAYRGLAVEQGTAP
jgi:hypothetical protein